MNFIVRIIQQVKNTIHVFAESSEFRKELRAYQKKLKRLRKKAKKDFREWLELPIPESPLDTSLDLQWFALYLNEKDLLRYDAEMLKRRKLCYLWESHGLPVGTTMEEVRGHFRKIIMHNFSPRKSV